MDHKYNHIWVRSSLILTPFIHLDFLDGNATSESYLPWVNAEL